MTNTKVKYSDLQVGDFLVDYGIYVVAVFHDPEGLWLETSDGGAGYVLNPSYLLTVSL